MIEQSRALESHRETVKHLHHRMVDTVSVVTVTGQDKRVGTYDVVVGEPEGGGKIGGGGEQESDTRFAADLWALWVKCVVALIKAPLKQPAPKYTPAK